MSFKIQLTDTGRYSWVIRKGHVHFWKWGVVRTYAQALACVKLNMVD